MISDAEPGFVLSRTNCPVLDLSSEQEVMQMAQCVWIRGEFIAQLFAFLPCWSAPTALLQTPDIGAVQEL